MTTSIQIHNVEAVRLTQVEGFFDNPENPFYTRTITIQTADGQVVRITVFAKDFEQLFIKS